MTLNISEFKNMQSYIESVNKLSIDDIEIEGIEILDSVREDWRLIGSNNVNFVEFLIAECEEGINPVKRLWKEDDEN